MTGPHAQDKCLRDQCQSHCVTDHIFTDERDWYALWFAVNEEMATRSCLAIVVVSVLSFQAGIIVECLNNGLARTPPSKSAIDR